MLNSDCEQLFALKLQLGISRTGPAQVSGEKLRADKLYLEFILTGGEKGKTHISNTSELMS